MAAWCDDDPVGGPVPARPRRGAHPNLRLANGERVTAAENEWPGDDGEAREGELAVRWGLVGVDVRQGWSSKDAA